MTGWLGDFFRFWGALLYWNARKSWFRLRGAHRDDCPCQNRSDSGRALDARCDATIFWNEPGRFRRVCPLLVRTPDGWRCRVDAGQVRPFWGRAGAYGGAALLALYLAGSVLAFGVLRIAHYPVRYASVVWPPRWPELRTAQEKLYLAEAHAAFEKHRYQEATLALEMVCQINPRNDEASLALAQLAQLSGQVHVTDQIYERLMRELPEKRPGVAQQWLRSLLARAEYAKIKPLAAAMLHEDDQARGAWVHALLFACRQTADSAALGHARDAAPPLPTWCGEMLTIEQALIEHRYPRAIPRLVLRHEEYSGLLPYYQVDRLLQLGRIDDAGTLLQAYGSVVAPPEGSFLQLQFFREKKWTSLFDLGIDGLLAGRMTPRVIAPFTAYLIAHPDAPLVDRLCTRLLQDNAVVNDEMVSCFQASYLAAVVAANRPAAEKLLGAITRSTRSDAQALQTLGALLQAGRPDPRLPRVLPLVPLPLETTYAILERMHSPAAP